ncbi:MAG: hypothetical protein HOP30_02865 [Cyclobacteriaceae bacterium]|nr:hypothetical protein [Cyclobacteriaceae bacterium]
MDEKISSQAIGQYSEHYASKLADQFFSKKETISGPEILTLCEVKQVNMFIIRELMHAWKQESEKLKSPYFDYQAPAVQDALLQFQNALSNFISVSRKDFVPLLETAVTKTIYLIMAPYDFYSETLDRYGKGYLKTEYLKGEVKYLRINQAPLERLVAKLQEQKIDVLTGNEAFGMLDSILEEVNFTPEDFEGYLGQFSKLVPLRVDRLFEVRPVVKQPEVKKAEPIKVASEPIAKENKPTLAENLARQKTTKLKDSLTINQKFMFTKILFKGDFEIFSETIDRLDSFETLNHALAFLGDHYMDWDRESEEYEEFLEVLEKRFS